MSTNNNRTNVFYSYIIKTYLFHIIIVNTIASMVVTTFIGFEGVTEDGQTIPLSGAMRTLLLLNSFTIILALLFIFIFIKKKTDHIELLEEKVRFLKKHKAELKGKFYIVLVMLTIPALIISGNSLLDSNEVKNNPCGVYSKESKESQKTGTTYILNVRCDNKNEYAIKVDYNTWNKEKEGSKVIISTTSGGLGLERIKKISY